MRTKELVLLLAIGALSACASTPRGGNVIIDTQGVNMQAYQTDLNECRAYADEVSVAQQAAQGAAVGAVVTGAIGAVVGGQRVAERGAAAGGISGGARGTMSGLQEREQVVKTCLRGRGYKVLN